jgi:hypothetical protein
MLQYLKIVKPNLKYLVCAIIFDKYKVKFYNSEVIRAIKYNIVAKNFT